jgi:hypothetical protein
MYFAGRLRSGLLLPISVVELWPQHARFAGTVRVVLSVPATSETAIVALPDQRGVTFRIAPGKAHALVFTACSSGPWKAAFQLEEGSVRASMPLYRPNPRLCRHV